MTEDIIDPIEIQEDEEEQKPLNHYVDRKKLLAEMVEYRKTFFAAREAGDPRPPVTDYMAKCFMDIATHLAYRRNFSGYSYKDEMIMDGVEVCLRYAHNFNAEKYSHPFAYFNKIIWQAFVHRIKKEKDQQAIKGQLILQYSIDSLFEDSEDMESDINNNVIEYLKENSFIQATPTMKKRKKPEYKKSGIELFMEDEDLGGDPIEVGFFDE